MAQTNCQADGDNLLSIEMLFKRYVSYIINRLETRREKGMQLFFRQPYCSAGLMRARLNVGDHISLLAGQCGEKGAHLVQLAIFAYAATK